MSNLSIIETLSHTLNEADLQDAIRILANARKKRQDSKMFEMKNTLVAGDAVEFYHSQRGKYIRGTIKKTKTKKALVIQEGSTMTWDVPMGMLNKV